MEYVWLICVMVLTDDFLLNQCRVLVQMAESHTETFIDVWAGKRVQEWLISELEKECTGRMWRFSVFLQPLVYKARLMLTFSHPDQVVFTRLMLIWLNYLTFLHCAFSNVFSNCLQDCKSRLCILHSDMILTKLYLLDTGHVLMLLWIHPWLHQGFPFSPMYAQLQPPRMTNMDCRQALVFDARM